MSRLTSARGIFAVLAVLISSPAFATAYTSSQSGDWATAATWSPNGVPTAGDTVTITGSHVITVTGAESVDTVTFVSNSGNKELHIDGGGSLDVQGALNAVTLNPSTDGVNLLLMNGGTMTVPNGSLLINGGGLTVARTRFSSLGGTLSVGGNVIFSGSSINAQLWFDTGSPGTLEIGGDLGNNGNIVAGGSNSTVKFNGSSSQTINGYNFWNLTIDKSGTATLNSGVQVDGDLTVTNGVFDDGGYQINLNSTNTSSVNIGSNGVLKLGSEFVATSFPTPVSPSNVTFAGNSAVVYQSNALQSIDTSVDYQRLYLNKIGISNAIKNLSGDVLDVLQELFVDSNVTASFDNDTIDVNGDINGGGTIELKNTVVPANLTVGGNWSGGVLSAFPGTSVTYDGSGAQTMLPATYSNLTINKPSGDASLTGSASVNNQLNFVNGNIAVSGSLMIDVLATVTRISGHVVGPLTMGMNATPARTFHVGSNSSYMPVDVDASNSGTVIVGVIDSANGNATGINTLDRYWNLGGTVTGLDSIQFSYNLSDYSNGDETKFILARNSAGWTNFGLVNDTAHTASAINISPYGGDWVVGQKGSVGFASNVAITSVNGGSDPTVNTPFNVAVETRHDDGSAANVTGNTTIDVLLSTGTGSLLTASANLPGGSSSGTATGLTYDTVETGVQLVASSSAGDSLDSGLSALFDVVSVPSTITVSNTNDSGPGSLRTAINTLNSSGCTTPCTIEFDSGAEGNIVLLSQLPAITVGPVTFDGDTGGTLSAARGKGRGISTDGLSADITVSLDGNNSVQYGLWIQTPNVTVKNLGFRNFSQAGAGAAIKIDNVAGCSIQGNYIGTDNAGATDEGNFSGIILFGSGATGNTIGGFVAGQENLISGSTTNAITLVSANSNMIAHNYIGTDANGSAPIANGGHGISLTGTSANNTIVFNRIAFNGAKGIEADTTGIANVFRQNEIFSNTGIAIDLGTDGPTTNTNGDADTGANNLQNYPTISSATKTGSNVDVKLSLDSSGGVNANFFLIDVYKADTSTPSQAIEYLGSSGCLAGVLNNNVVSVPLGSVTIGSKVVTTATAYSGAACTGVSEGTSELSPGFTVNGDVHWINSSGGAWETAANWDAGLPGPNDNAIIDAPGTYTVSLSTGQTIKDLTVGTGISGAQTLQINSGPLTLNGLGTVTTTGTVDLIGNIQGTGAIFNNGQFTWNTGTISTGVFANNAGGNLTITTPSGKALNGCVFTNAAGGSVLWSGGNITLLNSGSMSTAGLFDTNFDGTISDGGGDLGFTVTGTFRKSGGSGNTTLTNVDLAHNAGTIEIQQGALDVAGGGSVGIIDISAGKKLIINSDTFLLGGATFPGAGKVEVAGGTLTVNSATTFPALHLSIGTVNGAGNVIVTTGGQITWDGGSFSTGGGKVQVTGNGLLQITGLGAKSLTRTLEIVSPGSTVTWNGGTINAGTGGAITNSGIFDIQADLTLNNSGVGNPLFTNGGTLKKTAGGTTAIFSNIDLTSTGTLWVASGTIDLANATISGTVDIDTGATLLVNSDAVTFNATTFADSGQLWINGGTATLDGTISMPNLQFDNGTINGSGAVTHTGPFAWNSGSLTGTGTTTIGAGGTLLIGSGSAKSLDRTLNILAGRSATWTSGTINMGTNASISNAGTFDIAGDNTMNKSAGGTPALTNSGTLRKSAGAGMSTFTNVAINSTNLLDLQSGTLNPANLSLTGTVDLDPGTTLRIDSDVATIAGPTTFTNSGTLEVQGGTLMVSSNVTLPTFNFGSGTVDGTSTLTLGNTANWTGGTMQGSGATEVASAATLNLSGVAKILSQRTLRPLSGSFVNWTAGGLSMLGGGNIDNSGQFHVSFDGTLNNSGSAGPFANQPGGTLRKSTTTGSLMFTGVALANNGTLDIDAGKVDVSGAYSQGATGTLDILLGGVVPGTQHGQLVTSSSPSLNGTLNITFNGPYQPLINDDFAVIAWPADAHTGNFTTYNLPALSNGRTWSNAFTASGLHLTVNAGNADLTATKTATPGTVVTGAPISYTITVTNNGPDTAANVVVTDTLAAGHSSINASGTGWSCSVSGSLVTCTMPSLAVGTSNPITISANAPTTATTFFNVAQPSSDNPDTLPGNNNGSASVTVVNPSADLDLSSTSPGGPIAQNTSFQVDFKIHNFGPQAATGVTFNAPVPAALTYVNATPDNGSCTFTAGAISCSGGTIPSGGDLHVIADLQSTSTAGTHTITATTAATENDPANTNNSIPTAIQVTGAGVAVTNTSDSGTGSLRQALLDAQSGVCTAPCSITFNITGTGPFVITPLTDYPTVASNTTVDGFTQPGASAGMPLIEINASALTAASPGTFVLNGVGTTIRGLSLTNTGTSIPAILINGNNNVVAGNYIGIDVTYAAAPNDQGVVIFGSFNRVGGVPSDANVIAYNTTSAVIVKGSGVGNQILGNSIHDNGLIGIDLAGDGATPNVAGDADTGPNNLQNSPTVTSAKLDGLGAITVNANIDSSATPANSILVEFFKADTAGEGESLIHSVCVAGNAFGIGSTFPAGSIVAGDPIVATATAYTDGSCSSANIGDGTSEFSNVILTTLCTAPPATLTTPPSVCANATGAASVNSPTATSFNWTATNATIAGGQGTNAITFIAAASGNVTLSVEVEDASGCTNTVSNTFAINTPPVVNITGPTATCSGSPVTLDAGSFASYSWSNGATTQTITVSPTVATTYSVTVTDGNGCTATDSHVVTVSSSPAAAITTAVAVCANTNANAAVTSQPGATYTWTVTNGTIASGQGTPNLTFTAGATGNVTVAVTVTVGSCTSNGSVNVPITTPPVVTITGPTAVCANTPFTLNAGSGFASYLWSNGATTQSITVSQSAATQTYSVTVSNGACSATDSHVVTANGPVASITAPASATQNQQGLIATVPSQPGATYLWSIDNGAIVSGQGTNAITFEAGSAGLGATTLSVQVTLASCTANATHFVNINGNEPTGADVSITKTAPSSVNAGSTITYGISVHNDGPASITSLEINDPLPSGTTFVSVNDGTLDCAMLGGSLVCTGTLPAGATKNVSLVVNAPSQGTVVNTAHVSGGIDDPNASNNSSTVTTTITTQNTSCSNVPPNQLTPAAGATVDSPVSFSWSPVPGATAYELWIIHSETTQLAGTTASTSISVPLPPGNATWYVIARLAGACDPLTSTQRSFTVRTANGCATHTASQITAPAANSTVASPVTFSWMPVPGAIGYRLWVEVDGTAPQDLGTTDGAITLTTDVPPGSIVAYVSALFSGCPDTQSPRVTFNVPRPDPCADRVTATPLAPANNSIVNSSLVTFRWNDAHADGYRVWISVNGGTPEVAGTTTETELETTIANGSVDWWIENLYDGCGSLDSQHVHFTIPPRQNCSSAAPERIAPANGAISNGNVTFQWSSVPNAVAYELWLSAGNAIPTLLGTTSSTSLTHLVPAGALQWFVRAIVDRCPSTDSTIGTIVFTPSDACRDQQPPHAIAPLPNAHVTTPVDFAWSPRPNASSYALYVIRGNDAPQLITTTTNTFVNDVLLATGKLRWFVRANSTSCSPLDSAERALEVIAPPQGCPELVPPRLTVPGQMSSGELFDIQWDSIPGATSYQLQVSSSANFANAELVTTQQTMHTLQPATNTGNAPRPLYARVRAIDTRCQPAPTVTPYGPVSIIYILPGTGPELATTVDGGTVLQTLFLEPALAGQSFVVSVKEPWLSVTPSSGVVAAQGTSLNIVANSTNLPLGTSSATVQIELNANARGGVSTQATTFKAPTLSISKVTPVTPSPKSTPPPDALIIPAVAHASGINSLFQSDVRVTNSSAQLLQYQATFTPTGSEGLAAGRQTTFSIDAGRTIALDDVLRGWFGTGGENVTGTLEIRPMTQTETTTPNVAFSGLGNLVTFAASRTFNVTSNGTFGQYIPAIPFANFIGGASGSTPATVLSLQQIAQSDRYRTNLGIVEGSGDAASLLVKVFGSDGQKLKEFPVNLAGGQHTQLNSFLTNEVGSLSDGRVEISVVGGTGKVTAYASVLDNQTSDPLLVTPVTLSDAGNTKWVVPGVADLNNGTANWQTDMRLFNAGTSDVETTLTFISQNGGTPRTQTISIPAGQVKQFDKALASIFGAANDGGAIHVSTSTPSRLVATARTYNQTSTGTYGQFISGITPNEATGVGSRPLQILQVEETNRFRSNIGLAEVTGNPVKLELAIVPPDAKFTVVTEVQLQANEFRQINALLRSVGLQDTYNARVSVRVVEGTGRVTAYASVIDMLTNDPTYVPAQ